MFNSSKNSNKEQFLWNCDGQHYESIMALYLEPSYHQINN